MKQVLFWKYTDIIGQAIMLFPLVFIVSPDTRVKALFAYFTVGGWQAVSCTIMAWTATKPVDESRKQYGKMLAWILGIFAASAVIFLATHPPEPARDPMLNAISILAGCIAFLETLIMLLLGPVMAFWYAGITLTEIALLRKAIQHRSEVHWKL